MTAATAAAAAMDSALGDASAASNLIKPEPIDDEVAVKVEQDDDDDDLEALRLAALNSMKPRKPKYELKAHPVRNNLVSIVIAPDPPPKVVTRDEVEGQQKTKDDADTPEASTAPDPKATPDAKSKASGINTDSSDESEYEEYSEYVTDSQAEDSEAEKDKEGTGAAAVKPKAAPTNRQVSRAEDDDVLQLEDDEFTSLLNEFEEDLKEKKPEAGAAKKEKKKKRVVKRRKKVKKPVEVRNKPSDKYARSRSPMGRRRSPPSRYGSPGGGYRPRYGSPSRRRSPYSPGYVRGRNRSPSPYTRHRYGLSPSRRTYSPPTRRYSRSPPPHSSRYRRRTPTPDRYRFERRRGGSAPRNEEGREASKNGDEERRRPLGGADEHSKSLPPRSREDRQRNGKSDAEIEAEKKAKAEKEEADFQARLKLLPSPDREKVLARRKRFQEARNAEIDATSKKISLKSVNARNEEERRRTASPRKSTSPAPASKRVVKATKPEVKDAREKLAAKKGTLTFSYRSFIQLTFPF